MTLNLLRIGLVLIPFYEILMRLFPYVVAVPPNTRDAKEIVAMGFALFIGLAAIYAGEIKKCANYFLLILVGYIIINIRAVPHLNFIINGIDSSGIWIWKPYFQCLCFFLMFMAIQSMNTDELKYKVFPILAWVGFLMAGYVVLQAAGADEWYLVKPLVMPGTTFTIDALNPQMVGSLGNSTIVAPFIAMLIPVALAIRHYLKAFVMGAVIFLCRSDMAIIAMLISIIAFYVLTEKNHFGWKHILTVVIVSAIAFTSVFFVANKEANTSKRMFTANGRISEWKVIYNDLINMKVEEIGGIQRTRPFTGYGMGSYGYIYSSTKQSSFRQAHNEYLEIAFSLGLIGTAIFLAAFFFPTKEIFSYQVWHSMTPNVSAVLCSFLCISLVAVGTFPWQLGAHQFYSVFFFGLLNNNDFIRGD